MHAPVAEDLGRRMSQMRDTPRSRADREQAARVRAASEFGQRLLQPVPHMGDERVGGRGGGCRVPARRSRRPPPRAGATRPPGPARAGNSTSPAAPWIAAAPAPARANGLPRRLAHQLVEALVVAHVFGRVSALGGRHHRARRLHAALRALGRRARRAAAAAMTRSSAARASSASSTSSGLMAATAMPLRGNTDQQPVRHQPLHRLAHRRATEPDPGREILLGQARAGRQRQPDDLVLDDAGRRDPPGSRPRRDAPPSRRRVPLVLLARSPLSRSSASVASTPVHSSASPCERGRPMDPAMGRGRLTASGAIYYAYTSQPAHPGDTRMSESAKVWTGVFPAVTTKFTADDRLDIAEMERCFALQLDAGVHGIIVCGSLGEASTLELDEKVEVLKTAHPRRRGPRAGAADRRGRLHPPRRRRWPKRARRPARTASWSCRACPTSPTRARRWRTTARSPRPAAMPVMIYNNPVSLRRRHHPRDAGRARRRPALRRHQGILRRRAPRDRRSSTLWATGSRSSPASTISRWRALRSARWAGWPASSAPSRAETVAIYELMQPGPHGRGARDLSLVPAAARPRRLHQARPEHQAGRALATGSNDRCRAPRMPLVGEERARVEASSPRRWPTGRRCRAWRSRPNNALRAGPTPLRPPSPPRRRGLAVDRGGSDQKIAVIGAGPRRPRQRARPLPTPATPSRWSTARARPPAPRAAMPAGWPTPTSTPSPRPRCCGSVPSSCSTRWGRSRSGPAYLLPSCPGCARLSGAARPDEPRPLGRGAGRPAAARHAGLGQALGRSRPAARSSTAAAACSCSTTRPPSIAAKPHFEQAARLRHRLRSSRRGRARQMEPGLSERIAARAPSSRDAAHVDRPRASSTQALFDAAMARGVRFVRADVAPWRPAARRPCASPTASRRRRPLVVSPPARGRSRSRRASATASRSRPSAATMSAFPAYRLSTRPVVVRRPRLRHDAARHRPAHRRRGRARRADACRPTTRAPRAMLRQGDALPARAARLRERRAVWMGFRPSIPDLLPVIGRSRASRRVVYAFGHGHFGLTQSAATAAAGRRPGRRAAAPRSILRRSARSGSRASRRTPEL